MIKSKEQIDGVVILKVAGGITNDTTPELHKICEEVSSRKDMAGILLDLDEVTEIDTSAFACMIGFIKDHSPEEIKIGIINLKQKEKALIDILKIDGIINVFKDKTLAIKTLLTGGERK